MKVASIIKRFIYFAVCMTSSYFIYFWVSPCISIENHSTILITHSEISIPTSHLDFGAIQPNSSNAIYYSLKQSDGEYIFSIKLSNQKIIKGSCGYVRDWQVHKRLVIQLNNNLEITCLG